MSIYKLVDLYTLKELKACAELIKDLEGELGKSFDDLLVYVELLIDEKKIKEGLK